MDINKKNCKHDFTEIMQVDWLKMPVKICKCGYYKFAYEKELQKNIGYLSGYQQK